MSTFTPRRETAALTDMPRFDAIALIECWANGGKSPIITGMGALEIMMLACPQYTEDVNESIVYQVM